MANHHYYVPAGLPPGEGPRSGREGPPEGVYYYRIFGGVLAALCFVLVAGGVRSFLGPILASGGPSGTAPSTSDIFGGVFLAAVGVVLLIPCFLSLLGGRRPWVHQLGTMLIALSMITMCCLPLSIPMLMVWLKPETKRWYGTA
jgi:hypothetical protein